MDIADFMPETPEQPDLRIFALFDADGFPAGFYTSDLHPVPPEGSVEITTEQWQEFLENQGQRKWEDGTVVPGTQVAP